MKKRIFAALLVVCLIAGLAACAKDDGASGSGNKIYILTPSEDNGWTGSVAYFAMD